MIDLKTLSVVAAASAAVLAFSTSYVSADTAKAPLQLAQAGGSGSTGAGGSGSSGSGSSGSGAGRSDSSNGGGVGANSGPAPSAPSSGSTARGSDQCGQISDPRARQDCMQRQNDLRSGSGATGNNPIGDGPGITNRGSGSK